MKRVWILWLLLILLACQPMASKDGVRSRSDKQARQTVIQPISEKVLIPLDEQTLASYERQEESPTGQTTAPQNTDGVLIPLQDGAIAFHRHRAPDSTE